MLIILDRDGVINHDSPNYIKCPEEWIPIPGSIEAIALLTKASHRVVIATNQSGLNRKLFSLHALDRIHQKMLRTIERAGGKIDRIYFCPHTPDENCDCRKPNIGMFQKIVQDYAIHSNEMIYIGDSEKDYQAAKKIGCDFILVRTGNGVETEKKLQGEKIKAFDNLKQAASYFL